MYRYENFKYNFRQLLQNMLNNIINFRKRVCTVFTSWSDKLENKRIS